MKAVADLVNLFIASVYIVTVGIGCGPTPSSFFHIAALIWPPLFPYSLRGPAGQLSMTLRLCLPALRNRQYRQQEATESPPNPQSITEALSLANRLFLGYSLAGCPPGRARLRFSEWKRFSTGVQWFLSDQQQPP